jgi:protein ImuB
MADPESGLSSGIMSRIASVWLRSWPIARLLRAQASASSVNTWITQRLDPNRSLVLVTPGKGGQRIVSLNTAAREGGLRMGELLSNARSKLIDLQVCDADPIADAKALQKLALWAMQYSPHVTAWDEANGADGLFLNITGCAHLFGGEERLLADLQHRLGSFGLYPRLAVADTAGTAWALARHGKHNLTIIPSGSEREALANLPLAALRLPDEALMVLRRLGFRRCGELIDQPRAPFGTRFDTTLLSRLDQALSRAPEPLIPVVPPPIYRAQMHFLEPILEQEQVLQVATRLLETLVQDLTRDAVGARLLRLLLFKMDGEAVSLDLGLAAPSRDARHIAQLIGLRLYRLQSAFETDFGFEAAALHVLSADDMAEHQHQFAISTHTAAPEELARLVDRLQQRLGGGAVRQFRALQSHIPERAITKIKGINLTTAMSATLRDDRRDRQTCLRHHELACLRHDEPGVSPTRQPSVSPTRRTAA